MTTHDVQAEQTTNVVESLDDLAGFIDREYDLAMREVDEAIEKATSAMQRALVVGAALLRAKAQLRHGEWLPWLRQRAVPERTAQEWMRLARNPLTVADLGVGTALKLLASPKAQAALGHDDADYLDIEEIELDPDTSGIRDYRSEECLSTVRRYIRLYELLPPIVVYQMTDGAYVLSDGHLRLLAAQRLGYRRVRVEIRQGDRDAVFANFVRSNATHGRQPTLEEVKGRVEILAAEGCSPAAIAERLSLPVELVHRLPTLEDW